MDTIEKIILIVGIVFLILISFSGGVGYAASPTWAPITGTQYNMVAFGDVYLDDVKLSGTGNMIGAFGPGGDSDCRASGNVSEAGVYYLTIVGNTNGDTISFKVYDSSSDQIYNVTETVTFQSDDTQEFFNLNAKSYLLNLARSVL